MSWENDANLWEKLDVRIGRGESVMFPERSRKGLCEIEDMGGVLLFLCFLTLLVPFGFRTALFYTSGGSTLTQGHCSVDTPQAAFGSEPKLPLIQVDPEGQGSRR